MYTKLRINVTKDKIHEAIEAFKEGHANDTHCPLSLSMKDLFPSVSTGRYVIRPFKNELNGNIIKLPEIARDFVAQFDFFIRMDSKELAYNMKEMSFEIDIPDNVLERMIPLNEIEQTLKSTHNKNLELI